MFNIAILFAFLFLFSNSSAFCADKTSNADTNKLAEDMIKNIMSKQSKGQDTKQAADEIVSDMIKKNR